MIKTNVDLSKRQKNNSQVVLFKYYSYNWTIFTFYNEFVNRFEQTLYDFRLRSLNNKNYKDIVIVDIDTASLTNYLYGYGLEAIGLQQ